MNAHKPMSDIGLHLQLWEMAKLLMRTACNLKSYPHPQQQFTTLLIPQCFWDAYWRVHNIVIQTWPIIFQWRRKTRFKIRDTITCSIPYSRLIHPTVAVHLMSRWQLLSKSVRSRQWGTADDCRIDLKKPTASAIRNMLVLPFFKKYFSTYRMSSRPYGSCLVSECSQAVMMGLSQGDVRWAGRGWQPCLRRLASRMISASVI
jgi:hypothetical protein